MKRNSIILLIIFSVILSFGCGYNGGISITKVNWAVENIHTSFWPSAETGTCFSDFWINYDTGTIQKKGIKSVRIYQPDTVTYWELPVENWYNGTMIGGWTRCKWTGNGHAMPLGNYRAEIRLISNFSFSGYFSVNAPGLSGTGSFTHVYTGDYVGIPPAGYTSMLQRAVILSQSNTAKIDVAFKVNDSRVYSGKVDLYSTTDVYLGRSPFFRDFSSGVIHSVINSGSNIFTDDRTNDVSINLTDIVWDLTSDLSEVKQCIVFLTDGLQYSGSSTKYDHLSRSERANF